MKLYTSLYVVFLAWIFAEAKTSRGQISTGQTSRGQNSNGQSSRGLNSNLHQSIKQIRNHRGPFSAAITSDKTCNTKPAIGTKFKNVCLGDIKNGSDFAQKYCKNSESVGQICRRANQTNAKFQQCYNPAE